MSINERRKRNGTAKRARSIAKQRAFAVAFGTKIKACADIDCANLGTIEFLGLVVFNAADFGQGSVLNSVYLVRPMRVSDTFTH